MNAIHPERPEPRPQPIDLVAPSIACAIAMGLVCVAICRLSATVDEWRYVHDGVGWWFGGDAVWLIDSGTLPFPFWIQNTLGSLYLWIEHGGLPGGVASDFGKTLPLSDQVTLLRSSRLTNLLLAGPVTIWAAWLVAFRRFGPRAAAATALLCAVEPNLLAGYALATADAIIVPFALLAMLAYSAYLRRPSPSNLLATAGIFGLGVALKISLLPLGLLLLGSVFLVELTGQLRGESRPVSVVARAALRRTGPGGHPRGTDYRERRGDHRRGEAAPRRPDPGPDHQ